MKTGSTPPENPTGPPKSTIVIVAHDTCAPRNEDTERLLKLIGKSLTRVEIEDGSVYVEFDPFGSIRITTRNVMDVDCSLRNAGELTG